MKLLLDLSFCFCIFAISPHRKEEKEPRNKTHLDSQKRMEMIHERKSAWLFKKESNIFSFQEI